jgi:ketose-bisphosphate aldolase
MNNNKLTGLSPLLSNALNGQYAVGSFSCINAETALSIAETASKLRSPVIMMAAPIEIELLGPRLLVSIVETIAAEADVPVCLHVDHADDPELIREFIEAGFPSVMIDASKHDFEENVRLTKMVVDMAHPTGVTVEGELGAVGKVDDWVVEGAEAASLTDVDQAAEFVERTGVDALAVAIGNAHGIYTQRPELHLDLLQAIQDAVNVPLVLHGGSGTPDEQLHRAIGIGITKVNVGSDLCRAYLSTTSSVFRETEGKKWYSLVFKDARAAFEEVVAQWMHRLGSAGKA